MRFTCLVENDSMPTNDKEVNSLPVFIPYLLMGCMLRCCESVVSAIRKEVAHEKGCIIRL